jgi:hypothetical protein
MFRSPHDHHQGYLYIYVYIHTSLYAVHFLFYLWLVFRWFFFFHWEFFCVYYTSVGDDVGCLLRSSCVRLFHCLDLLRN